MANDYCTVSEVKEVFTEYVITPDYDSILEKLCSRASRMMDHYVKGWAGYFYVTADTVRYFDGSGKSQQWIDALAAVPTTVEVAETGLVDNAAGSGGTYTAWTQDDYFCYPYNALQMGQPFQRLDCNLLRGSKSIWYSYPRSIKITGKFGWSTSIPEDIQQAAIVQVIRWWKRGQQAYQDAGAIQDLGQLRFVKKLDPDIELILDNYGGIAI